MIGTRVIRLWDSILQFFYNRRCFNIGVELRAGGAVSKLQYIPSKTRIAVTYTHLCCTNEFIALLRKLPQDLTEEQMWDSINTLGVPV